MQSLPFDALRSGSPLRLGTAISAMRILPLGLARDEIRMLGMRISRFCRAENGAGFMLGEKNSRKNRKNRKNRRQDLVEWFIG